MAFQPRYTRGMNPALRGWTLDFKNGEVIARRGDVEITAATLTACVAKVREFDRARRRELIGGRP